MIICPSARIFRPHTTAAPVAITWDPSSSSHATFTNGNLTVADSTSIDGAIIGTVGHASGKYYFEVHIDAWVGSTEPQAGVATATWGGGSQSMSVAGAWGVTTTGSNTLGNGSAKSAGVTWGSGDTICVAANLTAGNVWFGKNGSWILSGDPAAGTNPTWNTLSGTIYPACHVTSASATARFASADWVYTPPSGFGEW